MRISSVSKKGLAVVLSMSMVLSVASVMPKSASAKTKSAKIPVSLMYCGENGNWVKNGSKVSYTSGYGVAKSVEVAAASTVTLKSGKTVHVKLTATNKTGKNIKKTQCLLVDTYGALKTFKKVSYSNVKVNGKSVSSSKYQVGYFESKTKTLSQRLVFFNEWGDDTTKEKGYSCKYACKNGKTITVEFDLTAK